MSDYQDYLNNRGSGYTQLQPTLNPYQSSGTTQMAHPASYEPRLGQTQGIYHEPVIAPMAPSSYIRPSVPMQPFLTRFFPQNGQSFTRNPGGVTSGTLSLGVFQPGPAQMAYMSNREPRMGQFTQGISHAPRIGSMAPSSYVRPSPPSFMRPSFSGLPVNPYREQNNRNFSG